LFVVAASLALAAMRYATPAWASVIVTATIFTLFVSIALAVCSRGERRSFWIGFAICGTGYLAVVTTPIAPEFVMRLATTRSVAFLRDEFHPPTDYQYTSGGNGFPLTGPVAPEPPLPLLPSQISKEYSYQSFTDFAYETVAWNFLLIGQCIWALILATLGGSLVRLIVSRGAGELQDRSPSRS
jgi:hypothetical protein